MELNREAKSALRAATTDDVRQAFCTAWPMIDEGLGLLKVLAPNIPTIGRFVVVAIGIVQAAGGVVSSALCVTGTIPDDHTS